MTGYGQGASEAAGLRMTVQLRSVNNRFTDLRFRIPGELGVAEAELRRKILAYSCRNYAAVLLAGGAMADGRRYLARALRLNPLSYRNWTYGAAALFLPFLLRPILRAKLIAPS